MCVDHHQLTWEPSTTVLHVSQSGFYINLTNVMDSSKPIMLYFLWWRMFQLQHSSDCSSDYLEVREGHSTGTLVDRFCGDSLPSNYTSIMGHILWIKFVSDSSVSGAGFRAAFSHCKSEWWITLLFFFFFYLGLNSHYVHHNHVALVVQGSLAG